MSAMSDPMAPFMRAWREPFAAALAHKAQGGGVVGYLSANAPVELIEAAGLFALRLDGGGIAATPRADAFLEPLFDPTVRGVCERLLAGELDFLDALILPRTTDSVQRLYYYLCEQQRRGGLRPPRLIFYDLLHTPSASSADYSFAALTRVRDTLTEVTGRAFDDGALRAAIAASNRRRDVLSACLESRQRRPAGLDGADALVLIAASQRMPAQLFTAAAEVLAAELKTRAAGEGVRLVLAGNAPDTTDLHEAVAKAGAVVVGDYHDRGELCLGAPIEDGDALRAISAHYARHSHSARTFPSRPDDLARFARAQGADGVLFFFYAQEEVLTWDYPAQRDALNGVAVPSLCLSGQSYEIDAEAVRNDVATFVKSLPAVRA